MYDALLEKAANIAEKYASILDDFIKEQLEPDAKGIDYEILLQTINDGIGALSVAAQTLEKLNHLAKGRSVTEEQFRADVAKAFYSAFANKGSRRGDYK